MKRIITLFVLILTLFLVMLLPVKAAEFDLVADEVGLLTEEQYFELNELAQDITDEYQCEVSIVIIEDQGADDVTDFTRSFYQEHDYGYGADKSGLMLLISAKDRDYAIVTQGYGDMAFTDYGQDVLLDRYLLPLLSEDQYYEGFLIYLGQTAEFLKLARNGAPFDQGSDETRSGETTKDSFWLKLLAVIFVPLLIAGLVCYIFLMQMRTAVAERASDNYISAGGLDLTTKTDKFSHQTETRTRIEDKSSSGSTPTKGANISDKKGKF